jgi:DNA polymerase-3 subunit delta
VIRFDGAATPLADILDECRSFGLLQQHKIVVVDQADQLLKDKEDAPARQPRARDLVQAYAEAPCESATLVLRAETWHRGKIDKAIAKVGAVIKCEPPNPARAADWAVARAAKRHGATLERPAAAALIEQTGPALGRIDAELAKLATAAGPGAPITVALVNELVGFSREQTVWHIQETVLRADPERILRELGELLTVSRVPEILVRYALSDLARKVHAATAGRAGGTPRGRSTPPSSSGGPRNR